MDGRQAGLFTRLRDNRTFVQYFGFESPTAGWRMQENNQVQASGFSGRGNFDLLDAKGRGGLDPYGLPDSRRTVVVDIMGLTRDRLFTSCLPLG